MAAANPIHRAHFEVTRRGFHGPFAKFSVSIAAVEPLSGSALFS
jgi:hypothetical protein